MARKYSDEAWKEITNVSCIDVAFALGYQVEEKRSDNKAIHMADSGGLYVWRNGNGYFRHSTETKRNAVGLVMEERACNYLQALDFISDNVLGRKFETERYSRQSVNEEKGEFVLPDFIKADRVIAYLNKTRGVDMEIIGALLKEGKIRQQEQYGNCCFIGFDPHGEARYCSARGTGSAQYRGEIKNSDKNYGFFIKDESAVLKVFESPIDAMSHATLSKMTGRAWNEDTRLSLGGTSSKALGQHLKDYPGKYTEIWLCLDNDGDGIKASEKLAEEFGKGFNVKIKTPFFGDFNEDLLNVKETMNFHNCSVYDVLRQWQNDGAVNAAEEMAEDEAEYE